MQQHTHTDTYTNHIACAQRGTYVTKIMHTQKYQHFLDEKLTFAVKLLYYAMVK